MSDALSKLLILLEAKDEASPTLKKAGESARSLGTELTNIGKVAAGFTLGDLGAQLTLGIGEQLKSVLTSTQLFGESVYKVKGQIGGTAESISTLVGAIEKLSGVESDAAGAALTRLARGLRGQEDLSESGAENGKTVIGVLNELGVSATDAEGHFRPLGQVLSDVMDAEKRMAAENRAGADATILFGRSVGLQLAPMLTMGADAFREAQKTAAELGLQLTSDNVNAIHTFTMRQREMNESLAGLKLSLGVALMPLFSEAATAVTHWAETLSKDGGRGAKQLGQDLKELADDARAAFGAIKSVVDIAGDVGKLTGGGPTGAITSSEAQRERDEAGKFFSQLGTFANAFVQHLQEPGLNPTQAFQAAQSDLAKSQAQDAARALPVRPEKFRFEHDLMGADNPSARQAFTIEERKAALDQADVAGRRGLEVVQHQINVLERDSLELRKQSAAAELALIPIKQQQADLELQLLQTQDQRAQIERETAVNRARLAAMPSSAALEDNQFGQQLLQAQIRAGALSGQGVNPDDIKQLIKLKFGEADLEVAALKAGHAVTVAERGQQAGDLRTNIATAPIRMSLADVMIDAAKAQQGADAVAAAARTELLGKTQQIIDLETKRRDLEDKLFDIQQKRADLSGATVNVSLTVNEATGQPDYDKLVKDLANAVTAAMDRASHNLELPAPSTVPGGGF